jgi:2-polyprenyl-6-hydroxyphenyl methylase/3-demethylubiquinone-9 3-methyltransferase
VAADTFIYFGRLEPFLRAAADRLAPGGLLIASIEESTLPGVACAIQPSGRYRHHRDYVAAALAAAGFELLSVAAVDVRIELGQPVPGLLLVARLRTSQRQ